MRAATICRALDTQPSRQTVLCKAVVQKHSFDFDTSRNVMPDCEQETVAGKPAIWTSTNMNGDASHVTERATNQKSSLCPSRMEAESPPCRVSRDGVLGRHLVATRDISAGEVILQEAPLATGPPLDQPPSCVSCYAPLSAATRQLCKSGCGWPVCSDACAQSATHRPECDVTRKYRGEKVEFDNWDVPSPLFANLLVLRCMWTRDSNPDVWVKLSALESHCAMRKQTGKYEAERVSVAQFIRKYFKLEAVFTEEEILRMCGVIQINGYGVRLTDPSYTAVYDTLSFIEHHCIANCSKSWSPTGVLTVRTATDVPKDAHLSICYTEPLWGTVGRRQHLSQELLSCRCDRCSDPTEHATFYSAVRCFNTSCDGYLLPINPLGADSGNVINNNIPAEVGASKWSCSECGDTRTAGEVSTILDNVKSKMNFKNKSDVKYLMKLLEDGKDLLHPNHFYLTEIKIELCKLIGDDSRGLPGLTDHELLYKMALCRDVLALADVLFIGVNRVTGVIRFELQRTLVEDARRKSANGHLDSSLIDQQLIEAHTLLAEAVAILSYEPSTLPEGQVAVRAKKQLEDLQMSFQDITLHTAYEL